LVAAARPCSQVAISASSSGILQRLNADWRRYPTP
jgi:hypothetical protein